MNIDNVQPTKSFEPLAGAAEKEEWTHRFGRQIFDAIIAAKKTADIDYFLREVVLNDLRISQRSTLDALFVARDRLIAWRNEKHNGQEEEGKRVELLRYAHPALIRAIIKVRLVQETPKSERKDEPSWEQVIVETALKFEDAEMFEKFLRDNVINGEKIRDEKTLDLLRVVRGKLVEEGGLVFDENDEKREVIEYALAAVSNAIKKVHQARGKFVKEVERIEVETQKELRSRAEQTERKIRVLLDTLLHAGILARKEMQPILDEIEVYKKEAVEGSDEKRYALLQMSLVPILHILQDAERKKEPSSELLTELSRRAYNELYVKLREAAHDFLGTDLDAHISDDATIVDNDIISVFIDPRNVERLSTFGLDAAEIDSFAAAAVFLKNHQADYMHSSTFAAKQFLESFDKVGCRHHINTVSIVLDKALVHRMKDELVKLLPELWDARVYTYTPEVILDKMMKKADEQYQAGFRRSYSRLRPKLEAELRDAEKRLRENKTPR